MAGCFSPHAGSVAAFAAAQHVAKLLLTDISNQQRTPAAVVIAAYLLNRAQLEPQSWPAALTKDGVKKLAEQAGAAWARAGRALCAVA